MGTSFMEGSLYVLEASIYIIILVKYDLEPWPEMNSPGDQARATVQATVRPAATPALEAAGAVIGLCGRLAAVVGS